MNQLFEFIKNQAENILTQNPDINDAQNDQVYAEAENVITNGLKSMNPGELEMLQNKVANGAINVDSPEIQGFTNQFTDSITSKLGLNGNAAKAIAAAIIPLLLSKLLGNKSNNTATASSGGFNLESILGSVLGGGNANASNQQSNGGLMDTISQIGAKFGLDKDGDGDVDLNDLKKML